MIIIKEEIAVPSPRARVWEVVSNPEDVVSCISGAELGAAHDDGSFDGALTIKFGAIRVKFAARVRVELDEAEHTGRLSARGGDGQGATRFQAEAEFRVVEGDGAGETGVGSRSARVAMTGTVTLTGKLASLVEAGAGAVVSRMTKDFTAKLVWKCTETELAPSLASALTLVEPAEVRVGLPSRIRAWFARVVLRRPPALAIATVQNTVQNEEIGSGHGPTE
ncbi:carbon monoxide dehydrogenase subunit G [Catenulispora acidiphila DSM 44928]|uniref:Carbon monoxide dehydrogenase subunit G n=1 Tax=Catenulispora acidiphila (strain DSM 44928 / JCM 14897 / NBRC 102108 / NRRL B-24433 / ID139908) TaxID=479433 RepID=C7QEM9_CATAD|nr:SRPBCC domain-containing protein [Catenulispora acidiphila]ACU72799.1 carbon monoxide dehydrogenase subunit G [Catenulispora acidiphila DSM 44928]